MRLPIIFVPLFALLACAALGACDRSAETPTETETPAAAGTPFALAPAAPQTDATVAGTQFNATSAVPCARYAGQPTSACDAGVMRQDDGSATVTVTWPGGGSREIFFDAAGKPIGFDANEADGSAAFELEATRNVDLNLISIGEERYEIPDVFVVGD